MDNGDDLQWHYRMFKLFCAPHEKEILTHSLFYADLVFVQSFVGGLISEARIIKYEKSWVSRGSITEDTLVEI